MNEQELVAGFMRAWGELDLDNIMDFFTEDAEYINIPMDPPNRGKAAIRAFIEGFIASADEIEFLIHNQLTNGQGLVMNERTDRISMNGKWVELPVMGVFEIRDGKIAKWRDYFDMAPFTRAFSS